MTDSTNQLNNINTIKRSSDNEDLMSGHIRSSLSDDLFIFIFPFSSHSIAFLFSFSSSHSIISSSVHFFFSSDELIFFCFLLKFTPSLLLLHFSGSSVTIQVSYTYLLIHLHFYFNLLFYYSFFTF